MSQCDAILKNGVFNTVITNNNNSTAENLYEWLKSVDYGTLQTAQNDGLQIDFPISGVPVNITGSISNAEFQNWKKAVNQGRTRVFTNEEANQIVEKSASPLIVKAWRDCVLPPTTGLLHYVSEGDAGAFTILFRWAPNSPDDKAPTVAGFDVIGATAVNPLKVGQTITFGGITVLFTRQKSSSGTDLYPEASVVLNTTKGTVAEMVSAISQPVPETPPFQVQVFSSQGPSAPHPSVSVSVPEGYKVVGGGARVNYHEPGNMLTASYPASPQTWTAMGKDHEGNSPATIDGFALGLHDPKDEWDVVIVPVDSPPANHPEAVASVPQGYVMTGGGAFVRYQGEGNLLTASYPIDSQSWAAKGKDHEAPDPASLTVYAIGVRPRNGAPNVKMKFFHFTSDIAAHPSGQVQVDSGLKLVGGGAIVNWTGEGNLLTASYPQGSAWVAAAKEHIRPDHAAITVYAIGAEPVFATLSQSLVSGAARGTVRTTPLQSGWRFCRKCRVICFAGSGPEPCPAGGKHDYTQSSNYYMLYNLQIPFGQRNWRYCRKCQGLTFASGPAAGRCPGGGEHDHTGSFEYYVPFAGHVAGQSDWRWCRKCQALAFGASGAGICSAGGTHDHNGSGVYQLVHDVS